jgi:hypothetical protein
MYIWQKTVCDTQYKIIRKEDNYLSIISGIGPGSQNYCIILFQQTQQ